MNYLKCVELDYRTPKGTFFFLKKDQWQVNWENKTPNQTKLRGLLTWSDCADLTVEPGFVLPFRMDLIYTLSDCRNIYFKYLFITEFIFYWAMKRVQSFTPMEIISGANIYSELVSWCKRKKRHSITKHCKRSTISQILSLQDQRLRLYFYAHIIA